MSDEVPIIVALDFPDAKSSNSFLDRIQGQSYKLKVGLELFISEGSHFVEQLTNRGHQIFLDVKLHDIPNTVASACRSAFNTGVWMISLHAAGGYEMLQAAHDSVSESVDEIKLVAVTVLTSMNQQQLYSVGVQKSVEEHVLQLTGIALQAGMDGVVCSAREVQAVRNTWGEKFTVVTPGVRLQRDGKDDQCRVASPLQARRSGANYMVVGRPITRAKDPDFAIGQYLASWDEGVV